MTRFEECLDFLLDREGRSDGEVAGDVDTSWGVTQPIYDSWRRARGLPERDVDLIEPEEAKALYYEMFWLPGKCQALPAPVDLIHFDTCVNAGTGAAGRMLQGCLPGVIVDGAVGKQTVAAVNTVGPLVVMGRYARAKLAHYIVLGTEGKPFQRKSLKGWLRRVGHLLVAV